MDFSWIPLGVSFMALAAVFIGPLLGQFLWKKSKEKYLPPGPWGLPILGHLLFLWPTPLKTFMTWKEKYGNVFTLRFAHKRIIVLSDVNTIREFFSHDELVGCLDVEYMDIFVENRGGPGVALAEGKNWRELRTFLMKSFNEFGIKDKKYEESLAVECEQMVLDLKRRGGNGVVLRTVFPRHAVNAIWGAIGDSMLNENEAQILIEAMKAHSHFETLRDVIGFLFPRIVARFSSFLNWRFAATVALKEMVDAKTARHLESRVPQEPRDIIDRFQDVSEATTDPESSFHESRSQLTPLLVDLMFGAVETSSLTMEWLILYFLRNPEIQRKLQMEIDNVIGKDRRPQLEDRARMPFTEACILEALRIRPAVPVGIPKRVTKDCWVRGYFIPENAIVVANVRGSHSDPKSWEQSEEFKPQRFLDDEGSVLPEARKMIATFGKGKRSCPGERVAYEKLFMFVTNVFQNFTVTSEAKKPSTEVAFGLVTLPIVGISVSFVPRS